MMLSVAGGLEAMSASVIIVGEEMKDPVKIAIIVSIALVICVAMYQYFSPYQSCVRSFIKIGANEVEAADGCAKRLGGSRN